MSESVQDRLDRLESLVERQAAALDRQEQVIRDQRETIETLQRRLDTGSDDPAVTRRGALKAGGLLGLLGAGIGTASADPTGQVGADGRPVETLYADTLDGPIAGEGQLESLVGEGLTVTDDTLAVATDIPTLTVRSVRAPDVDREDSFSVDVTVEEVADFATNGLSVRLEVTDAGEDTVYDQRITLDSEIQNEQTTVSFGADGGTPTLGPLDVGDYTATVTADADNAVRATATDDFVVTDLFAGGSGTESDPYAIATWLHLDNVRDSNGSAFVLTDDLDETTVGYDSVAAPSANGGDGFDPIGGFGDPFTGRFDGDGHTITGLTIDRSSESDVGLFGRSEQATLTNVGLGRVDITASDSVGGLVGNCFNTTVTESYVTGSVDGQADVGGLVGYLNIGTVQRSYATSSVSGLDFVGGLVGTNFGSVEQSYAAGPVTGEFESGGLLGSGGGTVTDSYFDIESTGQSSSAGGTGLFPNQLQGAEAESNMFGFDFTDVWATVDASDADVSADDYPVLQALDRTTQLEARS